jgi:catechol 2,3-dioxygenase-like lactoylglutathione lyase family enzyme
VGGDQRRRLLHTAAITAAATTAATAAATIVGRPQRQCGVRRHRGGISDLSEAVQFYHTELGIPMERRDESRAYLQMVGSHFVLQLDGTGSHAGGGPLHFALMVSEKCFDAIASGVVKHTAQQQSASSAEHTEAASASVVIPQGVRRNGRLRGRYWSRGPMSSGQQEGAFVHDPDGNEADQHTLLVSACVGRWRHRAVRTGLSAGDDYIHTCIYAAAD